MELGQLLKQARLEAGLSQRQLCGGKITRNMLSQIENGSAKPSMDTLRYLADRLGKPISYFLADTASPNQARLRQAREAWLGGDPATALPILDECTADGIFDAEASLLHILCRLAIAQDAISQGHIPHARTLLEQTSEIRSPYYTPELERKRLLLLAQTDPSLDISSQLPDDELLVRAQAAYRAGEFSRCTALLDCAAVKTTTAWNILRGDVCFAQGAYAQAREHYEKAEDQCLRKLELCCEKLGDYQMAYHYACKQR
ncbi:MAG: helix-turn-helix domain-containing protein [Oscillospiraceae bacterium]|nr:helix-turn-helix domain-containing protein [Oscillospiraceae bacterium]